MDDARLLELPISVGDMMGKRICFFGGGYLRLFPYWLISKKAHEVLAEGRPVVFYIHPREIDPETSAIADEPQAHIQVVRESRHNRMEGPAGPEGFSRHHVSERHRPASGIGKFICQPDRTQTFFHQYANDFDAIYGNQNGVLDSVINKLFRKSMRLRYEKSD